MTPPKPPDSASWAEVSALLDRLLDLPAGERDAVLDTESANNPALAERVRRMLQQAEGNSFLDSDAARFAGPAWDDEELLGASLAVGGRIGPYRVTERLAVGGMSVVYRVERDDEQFERTSVLKVLNHVGLDPEEAVRRFQAERQILATLDHPNIASVYDGGVTPDGRPYLILEYVPGEPITDYCASRGLSLNARLRLFETACRAVQHAHRQFIVHRDLKPGNIMVREDGTVKLLDFGIAKILDSPGQLEVPATRTGLRLLTPEYAAPEQIRGQTITSATDVYALGVLLYELMTGKRPYTLEGRTPSAIEKTICEEDPSPPSAVADKSDTAPPGLATRTLARQLRGDLDTIALTALRKEPKSRYASPGDLADDVRRHLRELPIAARSTSFMYRTRRYLWRNRLLTAAVLATLAFGTFHLVQITQERNHARHEAAKAEQVAAFLRELFVVSNPNESHGETVSARDLLDRGAMRIRTELAEQPEVRAEMLMVLGEVYANLSHFTEAVPLAEEALAIRQDLHGPGSAEAAASLQLLGRCRLELGQYEAADLVIEESLAARLDRFGPNHPQVAASFQQLGVSALNQNRYERADSLFNRALVIRRAHVPDTERDLATTLKDLGMVRTALGDYAGAEPLLREGLELRRRLLGPDHSDVYIAMTNLGDNLSLQGRFDEAVPLLVEGTNGLERILGNAHAEVAEGLNVLGITYLQMGAYDESEVALRRAVEIRGNLHGKNHPDYARGLNDLASMYLYREDSVSAEPLLRESLAIHLELLGDDHFMVAINHWNLSRALRGLEQYDEALEMLDAAEASHIKRFGADHIRPAIIRMGRAMVEHRRGNLDTAESGYRALLPRFRETYPDGSSRMADLNVGLGQLLVETGRAEEGLPFLQEGEQYTSRIRGDASMETAKVRIALAEGLVAQGRFADAEPLIQQGLAVEERFLPPHHHLMRRAWLAAAMTYQGLGRTDEAARYRARLESP